MDRDDEIRRLLFNQTPHGRFDVRPGRRSDGPRASRAVESVIAQAPGSGMPGHFGVGSRDSVEGRGGVSLESGGRNGFLPIGIAVVQSLDDRLNRAPMGPTGV